MSTSTQQRNMQTNAALIRALHSEVHDFVATEKAHYTLMFNPVNGKWVAWVTCSKDLVEYEHNEFERDQDARARLRDIYEQLEKRPLQ